MKRENKQMSQIYKICNKNSTFIHDKMPNKLSTTGNFLNLK